jgi:RNA polymerase sigma factor (sigma-70 family)
MSSPPSNDAPALAASESTRWPALRESKWFAQELQPHESSLRSYLHAVFPKVGDVDDVVQESYLRILRARAAQPIRSARAFLFTVARRLALDKLRHERASPLQAVTHLEMLRVIDDGADVAAKVVDRERLALLADAIASLPARCRDVFIFHKIKGHSRRETAAQLGLAEKTVEVQTANAMRRCGEYLRRHGEGVSNHERG